MQEWLKRSESTYNLSVDRAVYTTTLTRMEQALGDGAHMWFGIRC
jgi:hypothetical protein